MQIILARHAETAWNVEGRYQGQSHDIPLSEIGHAQAAAMAKRLDQVTLTRIHCSPLLRARQTAEAALAGRDLAIQEDADLMEIAHGEWEGHLDADIRTRFPDLRRAWRETPHRVTLPGGECFQDVSTRAWVAFRKACSGLEPHETALIVSHDGVNRAILCHILGLPLERVWSFRQAPTCLNLLEGPDPEHLAVVRLNDAFHLSPLFGEVVHRRL